MPDGRAKTGSRDLGKIVGTFLSWPPKLLHKPQIGFRIPFGQTLIREKVVLLSDRRKRGPFARNFGKKLTLYDLNRKYAWILHIGSNRAFPKIPLTKMEGSYGEEDEKNIPTASEAKTLKVFEWLWIFWHAIMSRLLDMPACCPRGFTTLEPSSCLRSFLIPMLMAPQNTHPFKTEVVSK